MSSQLQETAAFADELVADFIETGDFKGEKGVVWAIKYLTQKDLSELRNKTSRNELQQELKIAAKAEKNLLDGFEAFIPSGWVRITLTKQEKTQNIAYFIEDIAALFSLRNKRNPQELSKLEKLRSQADTPDYVLAMTFGRKEGAKNAFFIKNVRIEHKPSVSPDSIPDKWSKRQHLTDVA